MTTENLQLSAPPKLLHFGIRLQAAREAMGLERKDIAAQLRLTEKLITMLEEDSYPNDLPATFIRGYLRSYSKLLDIPDNELKDAIAPLQPKPVADDELPTVHASPRPDEPVTSSSYFMQFVTYLIVLTLVGLMGMWWYNHTTPPMSLLADSDLPASSADSSAASANSRSQIAIPEEAKTKLAAASPAPGTTNAPGAPNVANAQQPPATLPANQPAQTVVAANPPAANAAPLITAAKLAGKETPSLKYAPVGTAPVNQIAPDYIIRKGRMDSAITMTSSYSFLGSLTHLIMFALLGMFAIWKYAPTISRAVAANANPAPLDNIKSRGFVSKVLISIPMVIGMLLQDLAALLQSKKTLQFLSVLVLLAVVVSGGLWWKQRAVAPVASMSKVFQLTPILSRTSILIKRQIMMDPTIISLFDLDNSPAATNDGALNNLDDPQIITSKIIEYMNQQAAAAEVAPVEVAPVVQPVVKARRHHRRRHVPVYYDDDNDDNDADNNADNNGQQQ